MFRRTPPSDPLESLEREANDDFRMLEELGPSHFGAEHLLELREQARKRLLLFNRRLKLTMTLGACAIGWIFLAMLAKSLGYTWIAFGALGLGSGSFMGFFYVVFQQKRRFESKGALEYTQRVIEEELQRRAGKMPKRPRPS